MKQIYSTACSLVLVVLLGGCAGPGDSAYVSPDEQGIASTGVDMKDIQLVVEKMVTSMLQHGLKTDEGKTPVITLGAINNKTPFNVEPRLISEKIRIAVMQAGTAKFSAATDYEKKGGESGELYKQLEFQNESGLVDPATAKKIGQLVGADYILFGNIYSIQRSSAKVSEASYEFTMTLQDVKTGLAVWSDTKPIRKNIKKQPR